MQRNILSEMIKNKIKKIYNTKFKLKTILVYNYKNLNNFFAKLLFNLNVYFKNLFYFDILNIKKYNIYINNNSK